MSKPIVVLGMHRSGTSAIMGVLASLGIHVGEETELTGKNWENPKGFFERRDLRHLCDTLLHAANADWWKVSQFTIDAIPKDVITPQQKAIEQLASTLRRHKTWAVKEPRLCLLFPVFEFALNNPFIIFIYRHPLEVAKSLQSRNGFPLEVGMALWEVYTRAALKHAQHVPHLFVAYHDLIAQPEATTKRLAEAMKAHGIALPAAMPEASTVEKALHREHADEQQFEALATKEQIALWKALNQEEERSAMPDIHTPKNTMHLLSIFEEYETKHLALEKAHKALQEKCNGLEAQTAKQERKTATLSKEVKTLEAERKTLREKVETQTDIIQAMQNSSSWRVTKPLRKASAMLKGKPAPES